MQILVVVIPNTNLETPEIEDRWYIIQDHLFARWVMSGDGRFSTRFENRQLREFSEISGVNSVVMSKIRWSKYTVTTQAEALKIAQDLALAALAGI